MLPSSSRWALLLVLLTAAVVRGGVLWVMRDNLSEDRDAYREIAWNLAVHRTYGLDTGLERPRPTAYRPPLYPVLLTKLAEESREVTPDVWPIRVAVLHWLLGMGTVWLTWIVAGMLCRETPPRTAREWRPTLAALFVACDPILLYWSTYVMTETLAAFLAILALCTLARFHFDRRPLNAAFAGCVLGLAVLCRPTFLPWAGLCGIGMLFLQASGGRQPPDTSRIWQYVRRAGNLAALGLSAAIVVSAWGYRNYQQFGKPIITTTHGGYTLYLGNNEEFYAYVGQGAFNRPWLSEGFDSRWEGDKLLNRIAIDRAGRGPFKLLSTDFALPIDELSDDALAYNRARGCMRREPVRLVEACLFRLAQLWSPLPNKLTADESWQRAMLRYLTAGWYLGIYAAALAGVWRLGGKLLRSPWIWGVLLCLVFTGVHTFYWSNLRMRAPLMPFVAILAGVGAYSAVDLVRRKSPEQKQKGTEQPLREPSLV